MTEQLSIKDLNCTNCTKTDCKLNPEFIDEDGFKIVVPSHDIFVQRGVSNGYGCASNPLALQVLFANKPRPPCEECIYAAQAAQEPASVAKECVGRFDECKSDGDCDCVAYCIMAANNARRKEAQEREKVLNILNKGKDALYQIMPDGHWDQVLQAKFDVLIWVEEQVCKGAP